MDVLEAECERVGGVVVDLTEEEFARPTRCPPWDVKVLLAHMWRDMDRIATFLAGPTPAEAEADGVTYWRSYDPVAEAPLISARSSEVADGFRSGAELSRSFDERWRECVAAAGAEASGRLIQTRLVAMRLDEFLRTRVLEIAVHGLDLARALERAPWISPGGTAATRAILVGLLEEEPPEGLGWDDLTFIEIGTGRRPLTDTEREMLGAAAARFPLLG